MKLKDYWYTLTIIGIVVIGYIYSDHFLTINGIKLNTFIKPVLQLIMFGMGATMSMGDFTEIFKAPKKVFIGLVCQFSIMPFLGFFLSRAFDFPTEVAAGIVLIGASPSGLASNVMCLMAKANVALSITITTMATLLAPIMTPFLMKTLGGGLIQVDFLKMFWDMAQLVLIPIFVGLVINKLFKDFVQRIKIILPYVSMLGIAYIILTVTASGKDSLKSVGLLLILVVAIHNIGGYFLGYFSAKALKMNEADCRAVALEVGMQNAGLASALANEMGKIATVGLAATIFGPFMNVTGSMLGNYWGNNPKKNNS